MVDVYPNNFYATVFHDLMARGGYQSRIMIYSINLFDNPIDVSDRSEVENYATLLKYNGSDTDSNGRIGQNGIKINNYYNKDEEYAIGSAPICNIEISLINDDGFFSTYDWQQTIIIYWDVYDDINGNAWYGVPLGIYWWERPTKTNTIQIQARANDGMSLLDQMDDWSFGDMTSGKNLAQIYNELVSGIAGIIPYPTPTDWANMTATTYFKEPFDTTNMTRREILAKLAEIAGANAYMSRGGYAMLKPFTNAYWKIAPQAQPIYYVLDADATPTPVMELDIGEYTVPLVDRFIAQVGQSGDVYTSGSGDNTMYSVNNGFLNVPGTNAQYMVDAMYGVVSGQHPSSDMVPYVPMSIKAFGDPSIEAGDIIRVVRFNGDPDYEYNLVPIFQQVLTWNGADWLIEMQSSGYEKRKIPSEAERAEYVSRAEMTDATSRLDGLGFSRIETGSENVVNVASGSTQTIDVAFAEAFPSVPNVIACLFSSQTTGMGECSASIYMITKNGFSLRLTNNYSSTRSLGARWLAIL